MLAGATMKLKEETLNMRKLIVAAALAATAISTPALAGDNDNFTGVRIGATAGVDDVTGSVDTNDVVYGADVGVDLPVGDNFTVGVEAFSTNPFETTRTVGAAARVGYAFTDSSLAFVRGGYSNYQDVFSRELDGLTVGAGVELALGETMYIRPEYRYSDFQNGVGNHGGLVGVGFRF